MPSLPQDINPAESEELLSTKFFPSFIPGSLLRRTRLFAKLNANAEARLVLIHGAAGSGKSSLLYDYIKMQDMPAAWYLLEDSDRDLKLFLGYLLTSLSIHHPHLTAQIFPGLKATANINQDWKSFATLFINKMNRYKKAVWVALDDYHFLEDDPAINEFMGYLLRHAPPNFKCFIASRTVPKLPVAYLQSKNATVMLHADELRLDGFEIHRLFDEVWKQPMSEKTIRTILAKTEGWFAAVRLISQAIQYKSAAEAEKYLEMLNSGQDPIYDYVAHEIYLFQPKSVRNFLKRTSILNSFNKELAESVTGLSETKKILSGLEQMNLFAVHLDEKQEWFRYHHLFQQFLRNFLEKEEEQSEIKMLHQRAAVWHEQHKNTVEALEHFMLAREHQSMVRLLKKEGGFLFQQGLLSLLTKWFEAIPRKLMEDSHDLLLLEGQLDDALGKWEKAEEDYEKALQILKSKDLFEEIPSVLEKLISCFIKFGKYSKVAKHCREALEICKAEDKSLRSRLLSRLGVAAVVQGEKDWKRGYELLKEGYRTAYDSGDADAIAIACISYGFGYHFPQGNFWEARQILSEGAELLTRLGFPFLACNQIMNKAVVEIFGGMLEDARETLREAARMTEKYKAYFISQALNLAGIMLSLEKKDFEEMARLLTIIIQQNIPLQLRPWYSRSVAILRALQGSINQAMVAGAEMMNQLQLIGKGMYAPECYLAMGFLHYKKNLLHQAKTWFQEALTTAQHGEMRFWIAKAHYCIAGWFTAGGSAPFEFKEHYRMAVKLTIENNYYHLWDLDLFGFTVPIIMKAFQHEVAPEETEKIIEMLKPKLLEELEALLEKGNYKQRTRACRMLKIIEDPKAITLLKKARKDSAVMVRKKAEKAISVIQMAAPALTIEAFGRFSVKRNNKFVSSEEWKRQKALKLFKYLVAAYPKEVVSDHLIDIFWHNALLKDAKHNLAVHMNLVRKALNPLGPRGDETFIVGRGNIFRLHLRKEDRLDIVDFQALSLEGDNLWKKREWKHAVHAFEKALQYRKGELLEGDMYEEWTQERRAEINNQYLLILQRLGSFYQEQDKFQEAFKYYGMFLEASPLHEKIFESALQCLLALGDRISAKREYGRFKLLLNSQLSRNPSPALENLALQIFEAR